MRSRRFFSATLTLALSAAALMPGVANAKIPSAWARPGSDNVAVYLTYMNTGNKAQTLISATSSIARSVEIHHSSPMAMGGNSMPMDGMTMETVHDLVVEPHQTVVFAPGGYHFMLVGMRHNLKLGQRFTVVLTFRDKHRELASVRVVNQ